ncbi:UNVERIFIED_CONTAM: hypothetical protein GTU68_047022 [Idotea baltica]|nr:hypothetical protein [Idotea baltica]
MVFTQDVFYPFSWCVRAFVPLLPRPFVPLSPCPFVPLLPRPFVPLAPPIRSSLAPPIRLEQFRSPSLLASRSNFIPQITERNGGPTDPQSSPRFDAAGSNPPRRHWIFAPAPSPTPKGSPPSHRCPHCDYRSYCVGNVKRHIKFKHTGERPFPCLVCAKRFTLKEHLQIHNRIHTGEKPFQCPHCGLRFNQKSNLNAHFVRKSDEASYKCPFCEYCCKRKDNLRTHIRLRHSSGAFKPFKCLVCGTQFKLKQHLSVHMRLHTGEKPFRCPKCSKEFVQKGNLMHHLRKKSGCYANASPHDQSHLQL